MAVKQKRPWWVKAGLPVGRLSAGEVDLYADYIDPATGKVLEMRNRVQRMLTTHSGARRQRKRK